MNRKISIVGVPCDYGQQRRGVDMGPSAIRYAGLQQRLVNLGFEVEDEGNIQVIERNAIDQKDEKLLNLDEVIKVNTALAEKV